MAITRRDILLGGAAFGAGLCLPRRLLAAPPPPPIGDTRTLVLITLRGGWDALNVLIPYNDDLYHAYRQTIGVSAPPRKKKAKKKQEKGERKGKALAPPPGPTVLPLDTRFGLHPSLSALLPLYEQKLLAPIMCVGNPNPTRSHFSAQDHMDYGTLAARHHSGWLNRFLQATPKRNNPKKLRAIAVQRLLPRSMRGRYPVLAIDSLEGADEAIEVYQRMYEDKTSRSSARGPKPRPTGDDANRAMQRTIKRMGQKTIERMAHFSRYVGDTGGEGSYPSHGLANSLRKTAGLIRAGSGLEVAALDFGGWDDHRNQGDTQGRFAKRLKILGDSLAAFMKDLGEHRRNVLVLVTSEFGRTVRENGNSGTDHGRGCAYLALGGTVNGGQVYGKWRGLERNVLADGRDLPVLVDYRNVFAEVLTNHLNLETSSRVNPGFFPKFKPTLGTKELAFLKTP